MLRVVFMGSPDFAVPTLNEVLSAGHDVAAVYSQPPRAAGRRGLELRKTAVHAFAEEAGLDVRTPKSLKTPEEQERFAALDADVGVVVAYGLILPRAILNGTAHGCLNLHPSALPRWRGAAPIQRALMAGDRETAAIVMKMDEGLDTGPICLREHISIGPDVTASELHDELARRGAALMVRALAALERGGLECSPQPDAGATYAAKIDKGEAEIIWGRSSAEVHNHVRGLSLVPGAWCRVIVAGREERLKVLRSEVVDADTLRSEADPGTILSEDFTVACGVGAVRLLTVQRQGRKATSGSEAFRGLHLKVGDRLGGTVS